MPSQPHLLEPSTSLLEVDGGHEVAVIGSRAASRIRHGKQRYLVSPGSQQFHGFEQVNLGAAEGIVIFVAKQDSHEARSILELQNPGLTNPGLTNLGLQSLGLGENPAQRSSAETSCQIELDFFRD